MRDESPYQTASFRKSQSERMKERWADPEHRRKVVRAIRASKKKNKRSLAMKRAWKKKNSGLRKTVKPEAKPAENGLAGTLDFIKAKILPNVVDVSFNSDGSVLLKL